MLDYDMHAKSQLYNKDLNHLYLEHSELWEIDYSWDGFQWIDCDNKNESILSYLRRDKKGNELIIALNLTPVPRLNYPLGIFKEGTYKEIFNSDDTKYGGRGVVNSQPMKSYKEPRGVFENVIRVDLPPMGAVILKRTRIQGKKQEK
jgi:1,4-alpha-glucan branching enzyme